MRGPASKRPSPHKPAPRGARQPAFWALKSLILAAAGGLCFVTVPFLCHKLPVVGQDALCRAGFRLKSIWVEGRQHTPLETLRLAAGLTRGQFIGSISLSELKAKIQKLPWVQKVTVRRQLPASLCLTLTERQPLALWQKAGKKHLLDTSGQMIPCPETQIPPHLITVSGDHAPEGTPQLFKMLGQFPEIFSRVQGATRLRSGRWDLYLTPPALLKLPHDAPEQALRKFLVLEKMEAFNLQQHDTIDLRLRDRIFLQPRLPSTNM